MTPQEAIRYLTENELSPSTIHLLALTGLAQCPDWIEAEESAEIVAEIVAEYDPKYEARRGPEWYEFEHGPDCTPADMTEPDKQGMRDCMGCGLWEAETPDEPADDFDRAYDTQKVHHDDYDGREAYDIADPKHPDYHDTMSGYADM